ncbi:MAG TPA: hypothetical protein VFV62_11375 [Gaiellaceae bacterium]|nr:hypothetical protein [Gaiellaceae bacterium]
MRVLKTFARAAGLSFCVVAFAGTAFAGDNGNGNPPATPPGQEQKAETPAATPSAPQASHGQQQKAENETKQAAKKAEPKPAAKPDKAAKGDKPAKPSATPSKGQSANAHHHVIVCHRTGSLSNPYVVINIPYTAWLHAHSDSTGSHPDLNGNHDIMLKDPASRPGSKDGFTKAACKSSAAPVTPQVTPVTPVTPSSEQTGNCPATVTTTERVLVGIKHYTGAVKNGQRQYVVISPSEKSAHMNGKHADDEAMYETRTVTRTVSGESCQQAVANQPPSSSLTPEQPQPVVPTASAAATAAPVGGVAGAVSPAGAPVSTPAATQEEPAGGVLGAVASAPEAVAETATSGTLPFTGIPLWIAALIGGTLIATGLVLRRAA